MNLPNDILFNILLHLSPQDVGRLCINKKLETRCKNSRLWELKYYELMKREGLGDVYDFYKWQKDVDWYRMFRFVWSLKNEQTAVSLTKWDSDIKIRVRGSPTLETSQREFIHTLILDRPPDPFSGGDAFNCALSASEKGIEPFKSNIEKYMGAIRNTGLIGTPKKDNPYFYNVSPYIDLQTNVINSNVRKNFGIVVALKTMFGFSQLFVIPSQNPEDVYEILALLINHRRLISFGDIKQFLNYGIKYPSGFNKKFVTKEDVKQFNSLIYIYLSPLFKCPIRQSDTYSKFAPPFQHLIDLQKRFSTSTTFPQVSNVLPIPPRSSPPIRVSPQRIHLLPVLPMSTRPTRSPPLALSTKSPVSLRFPNVD